MNQLLKTYFRARSRVGWENLRFHESSYLRKIDSEYLRSDMNLIKEITGGWEPGNKESHLDVFGMMNGVWVMRNPDGSIERRFEFSRGLFDGKSEIYYDNGQLNTVGNYKKNVPVGEHLRYHANGNLLERSVYNEAGNMDGMSVKYYSNGNLKLRCFYRDGELNGDYIEYNEGGGVIVKTKYKDNQMNGEYVDYYRNGQVRKKVKYVDGYMDGLLVGYHENGKLKVRCEYEMGVKNGVYERYHENGQLETRTIYRYDVIDRNSIEEYDKNGNKINRDDN